MEYTLKPHEDKAALTALFVYARIAEDDALYEELKAVAAESASEPVSHTFEWEMLDTMSRPGERSLEAAEKLMSRLHLQPLCFIAKCDA